MPGAAQIELEPAQNRKENEIEINCTTTRPMLWHGCERMVAIELEKELKSITQADD